MKRCSWTMDGTAGNRRSVACSVSPIPPVIEDEVEMELMMDSAAGKMEASRIRTMKRSRWTAGYAVL
ncbi:Protein of unknown function [Pyronema omphalodes CBS 100304]|uniref:Uncharacterized protein n=1 Tax=Pyronema omphalodes (strain CBS 100304) TaxID=1076935 RepID=U4KUF2_PYROM|nr:Protein of unknown function [Pyronema omphalodes CBS 100304]